MNPRRIKTQEDLNRLSEILKTFYKKKTKAYGLMDREQTEYDCYADVVGAWTPVKGKVLDLGCGTYRTPLLLHQRGFETTGCDLFEEKQLKKYQNFIGPDGPRIVRYDGQNLPFENESFDTVATLCVFEHISNVESMLLEIKRVLRMNGRIVIIGPNLSGPHRSVLGFLNLIKGRKRYWQFRSVFDCIVGGIQSLFWIVQLYFLREPGFIYIYPVMDQNRIQFEQADDDAIHMNVPLSFKKWFKKNGFLIDQYNKGVGDSIFTRFFNRMFPSLATKIQIVAKKNNSDLFSY